MAVGHVSSGVAENRNSTRQVVVASLVGTSIEFYDSRPPRALHGTR